MDTPRKARDLGVRMVFQELNLAPHLTVAENITLGQEPLAGGVLDRRAATRAARQILEQHSSPWTRTRR